jgi:hypothetical protein
MEDMYTRYIYDIVITIPVHPKDLQEYSTYAVLIKILCIELLVGEIEILL